MLLNLTHPLFTIIVTQVILFTLFSLDWRHFLGNLFLILTIYGAFAKRQYFFDWYFLWFWIFCLELNLGLVDIFWNFYFV